MGRVSELFRFSSFTFSSLVAMVKGKVEVPMVLVKDLDSASLSVSDLGSCLI